MYRVDFGGVCAVAMKRVGSTARNYRVSATTSAHRYADELAEKKKKTDRENDSRRRWHKHDDYLCAPRHPRAQSAFDSFLNSASTTTGLNK